MVFVTGDIHGDPYRLGCRYFEGQQSLSKDDIVIVCGDFGIIWENEEDNPTEKYLIKWLDSKPFTTVFCDGNHENFNRLEKYPVVDFHGGKAHKISESVYHLMRGNIFTFDDKKFFVFGGARSHDISDGILDAERDKQKIKEWSKDWSKMFRVRDVSWWDREMPSKEEMAFGRKELEKVGNTVDYIISHSPPASVVATVGRGAFEQDELSLYLEKINQDVSFRRWYAGHLHRDEHIDKRHTLLYNEIVQVV